MHHGARILTLTAASVVLAHPALADTGHPVSRLDAPSPPQGAAATQATAAPIPQRTASTPQLAAPADPSTMATPEGFVEMFVVGVLPTDGGPAVVLKDKTEKVLVPLWIGTSEAHSIQLRLERRRFPRPLTHDLLDAILHDLGGEVVKIHVDDLHGEAFVGTVFIRQGGKVAHFDARPSDSIALAVGNGAPIFVSKALIDRMSTRHEEPTRAPAARGDASEPSEEPPAPARITAPNSIQTL